MVFGEGRKEKETDFSLNEGTVTEGTPGQRGVSEKQGWEQVTH